MSSSTSESPTHPPSIPSALGKAQPELYDQLFSQKCAETSEQFKPFLKDGFQIETYPSRKSHFRMRAEFRIWHEGDTAYYVMHASGKDKTPVKVSDFSIGSALITQLMPNLIELINSDTTLKHKLFQVEFLSTLSGEMLVTLIYHRKLDEAWETKARALGDKINVQVIGRSRKQKVVIDTDFVTEELPLSVGNIRYQQIETGFTQPNAGICIEMINWVLEHSRDFAGDLLELYCGNGNFTIPLSFNFRKVLATEISKLSTRAALNNVDLNERQNIQLVRLSAEEVSQAFSKVRQFRRLSAVDIDDFNFTTIFVDPPRSGLDASTRDLVSDFDNIIYISCNPDTLYRDLSELTRTHTVNRFSMFDQFPYTPHRECGAILKRTADV